MFKVVIADDEERICQLIKALIDWEALELEVVGLAGNGNEALEMVQEHNPDILITDIRMPGCSGLELIENAKKHCPGLEIIIISGYAHFEYAKTAIKFGVGNYLLKPIDKDELTATLKKLRDNISERNKLENDLQVLELKSESDLKRLRDGLMQRLFDGEKENLSDDILKNLYLCNHKPGDLYQICYVKIDGRLSEIGDPGLDVLTEKIYMIAQNVLDRYCNDLFEKKLKSGLIILMCYGSDQKDNIKRSVRNVLMQLEVQKSLFQSVEFTIALGKATNTAVDLPYLMEEVKIIISERIYKGTGRILDKAPESVSLQGKNMVEKYLRSIGAAIELLDVEKADMAVNEIRADLSGFDRVSGRETLELVLSCGRLFLNRLEPANQKEQYQSFVGACDLCGNLESLLNVFSDLQRSNLENLRASRESDNVRPIRQAKQYMQIHYSEPITMEEVSEHVGLSPTYFSTLFKKVEGEGFARYLINLRMDQAKALLRESNLSVTEICKKVGYNDTKHFTQSFEKAAGVKPTTYRKMYG